MRKILFFILFLPVFAFGQNTTTLPTSTSYTPQFRYTSTAADTLKQIWVYTGSKYNRWYTATEINRLFPKSTQLQTKLDSIYQRVVNLYDSQTVGGDKVYTGIGTYTGAMGTTILSPIGLSVEKNNNNQNYISLHNTTTDEYLVGTPNLIGLQTGDGSASTRLRLGGIENQNSVASFKTYLNFENATVSNKNITFPNKSGTVALTSDITGYKDSTYNAGAFIRNTTTPEAKSFAVTGTGEVDGFMNIGGNRDLNLSPGDLPHKLDISVYDPTNSTWGIRTMFYGDQAGGSNIHFGKTRGTPLAPTAALAGDFAASFGFRFRGATQMLGSSGSFQFIAGENITDAAAGTFAQLGVTPLGSLTRSINFRFDYSGYFATQKMYLGNVSSTAGSTFLPSGARLQMVGSYALPAWGINGANIAIGTTTYTDNSSSGTVANNMINSFRTPIIAASSATSYTTSANVYIEGAPTFSTNATNGGNAYAFYINSGLARFSGGAIWTGSQSAPSWTTNSPQFDISATNLTDNSSAGGATIATRVGRSFGAANFLATNAITITNAINAYFASPAASTNVTATNLYAGWFQGNLNVTGNISNASLTASTLVQTDANKNLVSSNTLPAATIATTQTAGDNTTKIATTAFVGTALGGYVPTTRIIATTLPLTGGGDLSANRTLGLGGLTSYGTPNQVLGMNNAATGYEYKTITGGTNISVTQGVNSITIASTGNPVVEISGTSQAASGNTVYIPHNAALTTITIPATTVVGTLYQVIGEGAGGWKLVLPTGAIAVGVGGFTTTSGGSLNSTDRYCTLTIRYAATNKFVVTTSQGTITPL